MIRSMTRFVLLLLLVGLAASMAAIAQEEPSAAEPVEQEPPAEEATAADAAGSAVSYDRGEHRDPFRSLLEQRQAEEGPRPPGPAGMLIEEIDLVGILAGPKGAMILIVGSDGLGYSLTEGAELYDGWVLRIDRQSNSVVFRQNVNDPTRIKPYRDIERRIDSAS